MPGTTKVKIHGTIKNIEKNFQRLTENKEAKRVVANMKKLKNKRARQIDKMLSESWTDIKKGYNREVKAMEKFFEHEKKKVNGIFKNQLDELSKMKKSLEDHFASLRGKRPSKKTSAKKSKNKSSAKKVSKMATSKKSSATPTKVASSN